LSASTIDSEFKSHGFAPPATEWRLKIAQDAGGPFKPAFGLSGAVPEIRGQSAERAKGDTSASRSHSGAATRASSRRPFIIRSASFGPSPCAQRTIPEMYSDLIVASCACCVELCERNPKQPLSHQFHQTSQSRPKKARRSRNRSVTPAQYGLCSRSLAVHRHSPPRPYCAKTNHPRNPLNRVFCLCALPVVIASTQAPDFHQTLINPEAAPHFAVFEVWVPNPATDRPPQLQRAQASCTLK